MTPNENKHGVMEEKVLLPTGRGLKKKESQNRLQSNIDNIHLTSPWVGAWRGGAAGETLPSPGDCCDY